MPTVTTNTFTVASSKSSGTAVFAFPDVCRSPAQPAPTPIPYPGVNYDWRASPQTKAPAGTGSVTQKQSFASVRGNEPGTLKGVEGSLKSQLARLHGDMMLMRGDNPERWHAAIDNYVRLVAELYKARASS